jgi:hypothetical protein
VNEDRGVYVIRSADQGRTWSEPLRVFNGAAEGHDFVGAPTMLELADGSIHILWSQQSINADGLSEPLALHHAGSEDAGVTFSEAARLVEAPVGWQEIVADGKGNLHGLWQPRDVLTTLWDQVSTDGGHTWQAAQRLPSEDGAAAVTVDPAGRLHLIGVGQGSLSHWLWDGIRWQAEAAQRWSLAQPAEAPPGSSGTAINRDGKLVVVWSMAAGTDEADQTLLLYTTRTLEMPPPLAVVQVTATQTPLLPTVTATAPPAEPSSTPVATARVRQTPVPVPSEPVVNASNPVAEYAMFLLPVALLLFVFLFIVAFRIIQTRFR